MQRQMQETDRKISRLEGVVLLLTALFVVATVGFFLWQNRDRSMTLVEGSGAAWGEAEQAPDAVAPGMLRGEVLDINRAPVEELVRLPGIGEARAADIVAYREAQGGFDEVEELLEIEGIGPATLEGLRDYVTVEGYDGEGA